MSSFATPSPHSPRPFFKRPAYPSFKVGRVGKLYLPAMAVIAAGFGIANYLTEVQAQQARYQLQEEERIRQYQKLMDAYGDKDSLHDVQHALEVYEIQ
ncbi:hypothetical protein IFM61606_05011 [Aspergillus udagawae]|uniref:Uncharacterized protein n=2 Tax=Aspergillus udagawae TaxID=91492 RepID=A0A8H3S9L0_9EURO|nr:uncharacterized protein Aud_005062 [Aspergillus udagawae]GFF54122.1 hypothetical protein IFM51744_08282 [Aspergillus udagawae]GFF99391.1 hypothetical protein IFM53868_10259 [Aspergillus udagawae]GFG10767.1 hypothetical protein IFM5058_05093 [Aspergillus udagawae]GFG25082.1 hypothetical protein IFM61606_05011 [Aspergillus udagawae]GIC88665.1 hypothetical protein Aud_005062 [Aspergillus udagawae]